MITNVALAAPSFHLSIHEISPLNANIRLHECHTKPGCEARLRYILYLIWNNLIGYLYIEMIISSTEIHHSRCNQTHTYCTLTAIIHFPFYGLMITGTHKIIQPGYYHPTLVQPSVYLYNWNTTDKWHTNTIWILS